MRIGVLGGGQLAGMMAQAARNLGIELIVQTPSTDDPAVSLATDTVLAEIDDAAATAKLATLCDLITFENEFIDLAALQPLAQQGIKFRPRLASLSSLLDKYQQRCYLQQIALPVPRFALMEQPVSEFGFPVVLKVRRHGYDGQGTYILPEQQALAAAWQALQGTPVMLEEYVPFEQELAVIAARSETGEVAVYPVVETQQEAQVCRRVIVPAEVSAPVKVQVDKIATRLLNQLQVVGVFGIELFLTRAGTVLVNEIAPRTHNSGHYTLDACNVSQFEMQLRAVAGLPLGSTALKSAGAVMVNLLGYEHSEDDYHHKRSQLASLPQATVHWYGKTESRPGRKLGHVTVLLEQAERQTALATAKHIELIWYGSSS
ncbi:MAG: 5-(carboxyamino)imidazole ribonucleotide synthase [Cyanophyceae cyanobacterium]